MASRSGYLFLMPRLLIMALAGFVFNAGAQLNISISTDREKYLRYEMVQVEITLSNFSGNSLIFSREDPTGFLRLYVETKEGSRMQAYDPKANLAEGLILGTGATQRLKVPLNNLYNIQKEGLYVIYAVIGHPRLAEDYRSELLTLQIIGGLPIWSHDIGLPNSDPDTRIKTRKVSLLVFPDKKNDLYALQVEDQDLVYGIIRLGNKISGSPPQCNVDALSHIHVLFMTKPRLFDYRVFDYNLQPKINKYYVIGSSIPTLIRDQELGRVMVTGGREATAGIDFQQEEADKTIPKTNPLPEKPPAPNANEPGTELNNDLDVKATGKLIGPETPSAAKKP